MYFELKFKETSRVWNLVEFDLGTPNLKKFGWEAPDCTWMTHQLMKRIWDSKLANFDSPEDLNWIEFENSLYLVRIGLTEGFKVWLRA
jgi:hypothetical protein